MSINCLSTEVVLWVPETQRPKPEAQPPKPEAQPPKPEAPQALSLRPSGLMDSSSALEASLSTLVSAGLGEGELAWRSPCPELDSVFTVKSHTKSRQEATEIRADLRMATAYLKNKLRSKFLQARRPQHTHGVKKGVGLSSRRLVNSMIEVRSGQNPTRPDWGRVNREECTLALGLVLDQSGSMMNGNLRRSTIKSSMFISDAMDMLGSPCLVVAPTTYRRGFMSESTYQSEGCHRSNSVQIDVFKDWSEPMSVCAGRFPKLSASGTTPLSDGIQYVLDDLSPRRERFRVVLVITDGMPDSPEVVSHQIRVAAEAGIFVIGVGIGGGSCMVKHMFPTHVSVEKLEELPAALVGVLSSIMFPVRGKRLPIEDCGSFKSPRRRRR